MGKILGFFGGGIAGKVAIAMAGVIVIMGLAVWFMFGKIGDLHEANGTLKQQNAQLLELSEHNAAEVVRGETRHRTEMTIVAEDRDRAIATGNTVNTIIRRIYVQNTNAPQSVCTDVPDAMRIAYDGLSELRAAHGHQDRNGDVPGPGTPAVVPAGPRAGPAAGPRR